MSLYIPIPSFVGFTRAEPKLQDALVRTTGQFNPQVQAGRHTWSIWTLELQTAPLRGAARQFFEAWIALATRADAYVYARPLFHSYRGTLPGVANVITDEDFETDWTLVNTRLDSLDQGYLYYEGDGVGNPYAYLDLPDLTDGAKYVMMADAFPHWGTEHFIRIERSVGGTLIATTAADDDTSISRRIMSFSDADLSGLRAMLRLDSSVAGNRGLWANPYVGRCLLVQGGAQTGGIITLDGAPASTEQIFRKGDFFTVEDFLYQARADAYSDSTGTVRVPVIPEIRTGQSPTDNAPAIIGRPYGLFTVDHDQIRARHDTSHSTYELTLTEDITR